MKIFFSVGEPSGDLHGANLIRALRQRQGDVEFVGYGGPRMAEAGCRLHADLTSLAVMWLLRVLLNFHKFLHLVALADRYFRHHRPDAVVLIDYPGFNWWIARRAKAHRIPVFYYTPPQIWAWASWRVRKMRRNVDHVLCALPFEADWFAAHGCNATFVGHPYFDEVRAHPLDREFMERITSDRPLVAILPGSRTQEVEQNLQWFVKAAAIVRQRVPAVRFAIAAFKPHQAAYARKLVETAGLEAEVYTGRTPELIATAQCAMAVSGSVSLELLYHCCPTVVLYWASRGMYYFQSRLRRVRYITLVNLLSTDDLFPKRIENYDPDAPGASQVLFPEYLTCVDRSASIAQRVIDWLEDSDARQRRVSELDALKTRIAHGGASRKAAEYILAALERSPRSAPPRPHYLPGAPVSRPRQAA
ncbi:MAG TPA: lipid-A-disaccharide synthase [Pirellulales bacterium]|nr:lipid-A-disaccharide synthase [Pirellulales bacterium]